MKVRLTTLAENTVGKGRFLAEHGLSILVETSDQKILFDTGKSYTAVHNARVLGVDLRSVDMVVLSHGHHDHTGGLRDFLREVAGRGREVPVVAHPAVWSVRYSVEKDERRRYTGIPHVREELESLGAYFRLEQGPTELAEGVTTTGEVPRVVPFEQMLGGRRVVMDGDGWRRDDIPDDQALVVRTGEGLVVVLGCAHAGVMNTLEHARRISGEERVHAVVGGMHLLSAPRERVEQTVHALKDLGIERLGVSHCTGLEVAARLFHEFGESFFFNNVGTVVEFGQ